MYTRREALVVLEALDTALVRLGPERREDGVRRLSEPTYGLDSRVEVSAMCQSKRFLVRSANDDDFQPLRNVLSEQVLEARQSLMRTAMLQLVP